MNKIKKIFFWSPHINNQIATVKAVQNSVEGMKKFGSSKYKPVIINVFGEWEDYKEKLTKGIRGKSILVIGGAGTIGSSYIKAALKYSPSELIVVDTNENGLTELTRTLRSDSKIHVPESYLTYPMSFNSEVFYKMTKSHGAFDIVANFAAHKHVRSEKDSFSIEAMIKNNVLDAKKFLDYLKQNKPSHFFCVSTDKAANPVNVMGGSKKMIVRAPNFALQGSTHEPIKSIGIRGRELK